MQGVYLVAPERRSPEYLQKLVESEITKWAGQIKAAWRDHGLRGTSYALTLRFLSASRLLVELFEQTAQRKRRAFGPTGHHRNRSIVRLIDLPAHDNGARIALVALLATLAAFTRRALDSLLAADRHHLPARRHSSAQAQTPNSKQFKPTNDILPNTQLGEISASPTCYAFLASTGPLSEGGPGFPARLQGSQAFSDCWPIGSVRMRLPVAT